MEVVSPLPSAIATHVAALVLRCPCGCFVQPKRQPGGFTLIKTRYLDPAAGWKVLSDYDGDFEAVATAARNALKRWQTKLSRAAVHGDMRTPNIYVRCVAWGLAQVVYTARPRPPSAIATGW